MKGERSTFKGKNSIKTIKFQVSGDSERGKQTKKECLQR